MTLLRDVLVEWALLYVGVATLLVALLFVTVEVVGPRLGKRTRQDSFSHDRASAAPAECVSYVFSTAQLARLAYYRDAVRAGYFSDDLQQPGSTAGPTPPSWGRCGRNVRLRLGSNVSGHVTGSHAVDSRLGIGEDLHLNAVTTLS